MSKGSVADFLRRSNVTVVRSNSPGVKTVLPRPPPVTVRRPPPVVKTIARRPPVVKTVIARRPPVVVTRRKNVVTRRRRLPNLTRNSRGQLLLNGVRCTPRNIRKRELVRCARGLGCRPRRATTKARLCRLISKHARLPRITLKQIKKDILQQRKRRISAKRLDEDARVVRSVLFSLGRPTRATQRRVARVVSNA
mgnify:CR=1 FL=1